MKISTIYRRFSVLQFHPHVDDPENLPLWAAKQHLYSESKLQAKSRIKKREVRRYVI